MNSRSAAPIPPLTQREKLAFGLAGLVIFWLIITRTFAAYLAVTHPEAALFFQSNEPRALITRAEADLNRVLSASQLKGSLIYDEHAAIDGEGADESGFADVTRVAHEAPKVTEAAPTTTQAASEPLLRTLTSAEIDQIRSLARLSIEARPINADAMSLLARLAEANDESDRTPELMATTLRLSVRESYAAYWLLQQRLDRNDIAGALKYADLLLRTRSSSMPFVAPKLAAVAEAPQHRKQLAELLGTNPPWRFTFLARLMTTITDARTPLFQYLALKETAVPPSKEEVALYLNFLASRKFYDLSYYAWLQLKAPEELSAITPIYNGAFELPVDGSPFDWSLSSHAAVRSAITAHPTRPGQKALTIEFRANRAIDPAVRQVLHLPPGTHTLSGTYTSALLGPRGLVWHVACLNGDTLVTTDVLRGSAPGWKPFSANFKVPAENCRLQEITLNIDHLQAADRFISGSIWFDDLEITRNEIAAQKMP